MGSVLEGKRLELLHELVPKTSTIAILIDPNYPAANPQSQDAQEAAARLSVTPTCSALARMGTSTLPSRRSCNVVRVRCSSRRTRSSSRGGSSSSRWRRATLCRPFTPCGDREGADR